MGLSIEEDLGLNYRFALPNKLFDYINAGIPVIASNLPEVRKIVDGYACGIIVDSVTPEDIYKAIKWLQDHSSPLTEMKENALRASKELTWENEGIKVIALYKKALAGN